MVVGSVDSLDVDADVIVADYATPAAGVRNAHLTVSLADLPRAVRGRATLEVDTLHAGGFPLYGLHADAEADRAFAWRFAARTAEEGRAGGALQGSVTLDGALVLALDTMALRLSDLRARLVRPTRLVVDSTAIRLDTLDLRTAEGGSVVAAAVLPDTGAVDAVLRIAELPLRALAPAIAALDSSARLDLDVDARLTGSRARPRIAVDGGVHTGEVAEGVADSIGVRFTYADRHADLGASVRASGRSVATARLALPVEIALDSPRVALLDSAMSGEIRADSVALPDLERFFPQLDLRSGVLRSNVVITGTPRQPHFVGTLSLGDGVLRSPELGVGLRDAQALIVFREDSVHIRTIRANADREMERGLGTVALNGEISVRELRDPAFDLRLRATQMPVARMERVADLDVSADLRLRGRLAMPVLSGRITVDRGELRIPELAGTVVDAEDPEFVRLVDSLTSGRTLVAASPIVALARDLVVEDVRVTMGNNVWLRSAEMNMALGGSVELARASATFGAARAGALALSGELRTLRGTYTLDLGVIQRTFQLEEGSLTFRPQPVLNPGLDINVVHVVQRSSAGISSVGGGRDVRIRAHVGGTLLAPTLELSSAGGTRMSQEALLSYLVTGRETLDLGNLQGSQFVTGELVTRMTGAAANWLAGGFFDVVTVTGGSTEGTESGSAAANAFFNSRIGLGKQVTDRVFITLNAGVCDLKNITGGGAQLDPQFLQEKIGLSVEYRLPRRLTLAAGSEPAASAAACGQQGATGSSRTAITVPRQLTFDVSKAWRF
jgi:translocation and assembly module TamB